MTDQALYKIALSLIPNIGPILARKLVAYVGSVEGVFKQKNSVLEKVPGIGQGKIHRFNQGEVLKMAETELKHIAENGISYKFYLDDDYPARLRECDDGPLVLYYRGQDYFNSQKLIGVVGTRRSTAYGEQITEKLIEDLSSLFPDLVVVSGFAYGIDICAHKKAMQCSLPTIAVFGHGVNQTYPIVHKKYVSSVLEKGALVSEFSTQKKADPGNFVSRNRIIAGLTDATIVIESGEKGGSLLTADMALSYNRDVFAFPGRANDTMSRGCNKLIKTNAAALIESANDLVFSMKWDIENTPKVVQKNLFNDLTKEEETIINALEKQHPVSINELSRKLKTPVSKLSSALLKLEFDGLVKALPGSNFKLV